MNKTTQPAPVCTMDDWPGVIKAMHSGEVFEMDDEVFCYWLEVLPPVYMYGVQEIDGKPIMCVFGFAEGAEPVTDFWVKGGRNFGKRSDRMNPAA